MGHWAERYVTAARSCSLNTAKMTIRKIDMGRYMRIRDDW